MNTILAIDTSSEVCSICLFHEGRWDVIHESIPRQHARQLLPFIDEIIQRNSITLSDIDAYVYGRGPGSFTGLRIASGVIQGFSLALNKPVYGVSTLTALASETDAKPGQWVLPAIDARMSQVYWCPHQVNEYGNAIPMETEQVISPASIVIKGLWQTSDVKPVSVGTGWQYLDEMSQLNSNQIQIVSSTVQPSAKAMVEWVIATQPEAENPGVVEPIYVRNKVTWDQKPKVGSI